MMMMRMKRTRERRAIDILHFPVGYQEPFFPAHKYYTALLAAVLVLHTGSAAFFLYAAGAAALAGVLLGTRAWPIWAVHATAGFLAAARILRADGVTPEVSAFVVAFRPSGQGIPNIAGYTNPQGAYSTASQTEYANPSLIQGAVTDASIYAAIASVKPIGTTIWTRISS